MARAHRSLAVPALRSHSAHAGLPEFNEYAPAGQAAHTVGEVANAAPEYAPAAHPVHTDAFVRPLV